MHATSEADLSPAERLREIAAILAAGFLRLGGRTSTAIPSTSFLPLSCKGQRRLVTSASDEVTAVWHRRERGSRMHVVNTDQRIKQLLTRRDIGATVIVKGWVRTRRDAKGFSFINVNDGSTLD